MKTLLLLCLVGTSLFGFGSCQGDVNAYITVVNITGTDIVSGTPVKNVRSVNTQAHSTLNNANLNLGASVSDGDFLVPDVCSTTLHPCDSAATCTNVNSSLIQCRCMSGYTDTSTTSYPPETTPVVPSGTACTDIDECSGNATVCGAETFNCTNSPGSYSCACNPGYELSTSKVCVDIDECTSTTSPDNCDGNATCTNTVGNFTCACNTGYTGDGNTCAEIDECAVRDCGANGTCVNNAGSYSCNCDTGFIANGTADPIVCVDEDECATGSHTCDASRATCTNTVGSFTCACNTGFTGNGMTCNDIDECAGSHNCHANATCTNSVGSFSCMCNSGFRGNGTFCEASPFNYDFRAVFNVSTSVTSAASSVASTLDDFMAELKANTTLDFTNVTVTIERITSGTPSEIIALLAFTEVSHSQDDFTSILNTYSSSLMIDSGTITADDYNECPSNYGNCSTDATCTNSNGSYSCVCHNSLFDQSPSGQNGTVCISPVSFTCVSNGVKVVALTQFFDNIGVTNVSEVTLGSCSGTDGGAGNWTFEGPCDGVSSSNDTHLFLNWNLTNFDSTASFSVGNIFNYPVSCVYERTLNVTLNITVDQNIINGGGQQNSISQDLRATLETYLDQGLTRRLTNAATVKAGEKVYFKTSPSLAVPTNFKMVVLTAVVSPAEDPATSLQLFSGGCPVPVTSANQRVLDSVTTQSNGQGTFSNIGFNAIRFKNSQATRVSIHAQFCIEVGGVSCQPSCTSGRKRRSAHLIKMKRQSPSFQTDDVSTVFRVSPDDQCQRDCSSVGVCVLDAARIEQCVCIDGAFKNARGTCQTTPTGTTEVETQEDRTVLWVLIGLAIVMFVLVAILIAVFALKRNQGKGQDYELSYVNSNAITK